MTPERWERIKELFEATLEREPHERVVFLTDRCRDDQALCAFVQKLLDEHRPTRDFLEHPLARLPDWPAPAAGPTFSPGDVLIGRFRIVDSLGHGGMGEVYEAFDLELQESVALKTIRPALASEKTYLQRFKQEVQRARKITHPNVCRVYDLFRQGASQEADVWFLTMELLRGETLAARLRREGPMAIEEALPVVGQMCEGLDAAHRAGVVHGDFKSANVMLVSAAGSDQPRIIVTDFGLARPLAGGGTTSSLGRIGRLGTPAYMAPEQFEDQPPTDKSDLYALGVVIYELVTGKLPFPGDSALAIAVRRLTEPPVPPSTHVAHLEPRWEETILRCLAVAPPDRFAGALDVMRALTGETGPPARSTRGTARSGTALAAWAMLAMLLTAVAIWLAMRFDQAPSSRHIRSIAVLPFTNRIPHDDREYFVDGLTEELTTVFQHVKALRVTAWTSTFQFKNRPQDVRTIGRQLNVDGIVEGSVQMEGDTLRIRVQLSDSATGYVFWAKTYDSGQRDLSMASAIASDILETLDVGTDADLTSVRSKRYTRNRQVYALYQHARDYLSRREPAAWETARRSFQAVIDQDPTYAPAYAGLADCYHLLGSYELLPPKEAFPKATQMASEALRIDDTIAEAHTSLAVIKAQYEWDRTGAEAAFKRAIELNPAYANARQWYAEYLVANGRSDEAIRQIKLALEIEPASLVINSSMAVVYYFAGQYDRAIEQGKKTLALQPDYPLVYFFLGHAYEQQQKHAEAIAAYSEGVRLSKGMGRAYLAHAYAIAGKRREATRILQQLTASANTGYVSSYERALVYTGLGHKEQAVVWLQRAYHDRASLLMYLKVDRRYDSLRSDPRFQAIVDGIS